MNEQPDDMQPGTLPPLSGSPSDYTSHKNTINKNIDSAWIEPEHTEDETLGPEDLFLFPAQPTQVFTDVDQKIITALRACYQSPQHQSIVKPGTSDELPIDTAYIRLGLVQDKQPGLLVSHEHHMIFGEAGVGKHKR